MLTTEMMSPLRPPLIGEVAPDFSLQSTSGGTVRLSAFRDRKHVLLAFFPLAFTSTCTSELCAFSEDFDAFASVDVEVLPISVDAVPSLTEFKHKFGMKVDLLSDFRRTASVAYGVLREDTYFSKRAYFLIDKGGVIRWEHVETKAGQRRENEELLAAIRSLGS
ncbi:MAG: redoxin domain-containing protein [Gemmatimonas sp.]